MGWCLYSLREKECETIRKWALQLLYGYWVFAIQMSFDLLWNQLIWGLVPYSSKSKKMTQFISMNWWHHLCNSIMYGLKFSRLRHCFLFCVNLQQRDTNSQKRSDHYHILGHPMGPNRTQKDQKVLRNALRCYGTFWLPLLAEYGTQNQEWFLTCTSNGHCLWHWYGTVTYYLLDFTSQVVKVLLVSTQRWVMAVFW